MTFRLYRELRYPRLTLSGVSIARRAFTASSVLISVTFSNKSI